MNANNPMTPGVYTVEQSAFPPSVAQVPTAIPAFIGYTQMAEYNGNTLVGVPFMVNSLSEYNTYFGGAPDYQFPIIKVPTASPGATQAPYDLKIGTQYLSIGAPTSGNFYMYNCLRLFYLNGGGPCYIVSVGTYEQPAINPTTQKIEDMPYTAALADLLNGLNLLPTIQFPKPTLILIPDGLVLDFNDYSTLQQEMIQQAGTLMDRVAVLDVYNGYLGYPTSTISDFRNAIGVSFLNYATAYYPWLQTSVVASTEINFSNIDNTGTAQNSVKVANLIYSPLVGTLTSITTDYENLEANLLVPPPGGTATAPIAYPDWTSAFNAAQPGTGTWNTATIGLLSNQGIVLSEMYSLLYAFGQNPNTLPSSPPSSVSPLLTADLIGAISMLTTPTGSLSQSMYQLAIAEVNYGIKPVTIGSNAANWGWTKAGMTVAASSPPPAMPSSLYNLLEPQYQSAFNALLSALNNAINAAYTLLTQYNNSLYNSNSDYANLMNAIGNAVNVLPPASAMAGIYTLYDNTYGVWESPANVNIIGAVSPMVVINDDSQASLNVDALGGKSINAIRSFYGRGPAMVWGARTLDGNSLDYRYISVRRTLIMIEQSIANAAFSMVFAPNDSITWSAISGMIGNFLNNIWQAGGLQGASPADAYVVQVGLGKTMTSLDILNGIMRVSVQVAVVHPAEFIIITYEQMMATS